MLTTDYFDRNGNKWSIEKGDWLGHQAISDEMTKSGINKFSNKNYLLFILILVAIITCFITFV
jgi:hypothetical protein